MNVKERKSELRNLAKSLRVELNEVEWEDKSERILEKLVQSDLYKKAQIIHSYVSMNDRKEVDTWDILKEILLSDKTLVVSRSDMENNTLMHFKLSSLDDLKENKWGISEPEGGDEMQPNEFDLILVPLLAADNKGNRIGYGKGFYDRFLSQTKGKKAGLVFEQFLFDSVPGDEHDQKLDYIITENNIIEVKQ